MKKLLIITKYTDRSVPFFLTNEITNTIKVNFLLFEEDNYLIAKYLNENNFDYIYIRDPFHTNLNYSEIKDKISIILENKKESSLIDNIEKIKDIFFEDKWNQYQLLKEYMPKTFLIESKNDFDHEVHFAKKRISSTAKGVIFNKEEIMNPKEYIIQEKLDIKKEYRIFSIFNKIINPAEIKLSKTPNTKVKVVGPEKLSGKLLSFVKKIDAEVKFDFVGYDVAETIDNELYLIEANRSCWFAGFYRVTGRNLANEFIQMLLNKK